MNQPSTAPEALVIMAKYPEAGGVKTRLARHLGDELSCQLYQSFLRDLEEKFGSHPRPLYWAYTPPESDFPSLLSTQSRCFPQEGVGLGERLLNSFRRLFQQGCQRVVIIGSDAPHLLTDWIDEAFAMLVKVDVVLAPAEDGGYNLVGLKQPHDLFLGISLSTPRTLADTLDRARRLRLSVHLLPASFDVDEMEDLQKLRRFLAYHGQSLPHTQAILKRIEERPR